MVPARIGRITAVNLPDGIMLTPNGGAGFVRDTVFLETVPWPLNLTSLSGAIQDLGFGFQIHENGAATVFLPEGTGLSFRFDIIAARHEQPNPASPSPTFSISGNTEFPDQYTFTFTYPDGTSQKMPSSIRDPYAFTSAVQGAGLSCRIDPSSGVLDLLDARGAVIYRGRPAYFLTGSNPGVSALAFEPAGDINGDGLEDVYLVTPSEKQVLYSLPLTQ